MNHRLSVRCRAHPTLSPTWVCELLLTICQCFGCGLSQAINAPTCHPSLCSSLGLYSPARYQAGSVPFPLTVCGTPDASCQVGKPLFSFAVLLCYSHCTGQPNRSTALPTCSLSSLLASVLQ
ncbi:hypothetical protein B0T21DRAFT_366045 [Apiosordaria backusii]|uniref:Secreted protein n=1 Tax=Apiosordaria backusii TaxID=314023 RepID=A0AA40BKN7_9PEZI|nr:hypothetical protein B0T21DRAFT_366045 [Apiosordaria backusii]